MEDGIGMPGALPLLSVAMPVYDPDESHLRHAIESVREQRHSRWELCIVDDGSTRQRVRDVPREYAARDPRVKLELLDANSGISAASNRAVGMCAGEYVAFLDHDDVLSPDALLEVARAIEADPSLDVVYSDQDKLSARGARRAPFFKPDWSPTYALGAMYIGHLLVVRRSLLAETGGFDPAFDGIQDFELLLRVSERTERIRHLPRILYHWRAVPGSIAAGVDEKSGVPELQARAVNDHLRRRGVAASAVPHPRIPHRTRLLPRPDAERPPVSVVIHGDPGRGDLERRAGDLSERAGYPTLEMVVAEPTRARNAAATLNRAAERATGEQLLFLAEDVEIADEGFLDVLLTYARIPGVGVVGPLSLYPDGRVEQAGLALRRQGGDGRRDQMAWWHGHAPVEPVMRGAPGESDGYYGSLSCAREVAAVPASCMLAPRSVFERAGGFDEEYRALYHDVDFCLRVRGMGLGVVCSPRPRVVSRRLSPPRLREDVVDRALLVDSWFEQLDRGDPYLSSHLSATMTPDEPGADGWLAFLRRLARRL
jgi:GT2 family glycosyltransferase